MLVKDIIAKLDEFAPRELAKLCEGFDDNIGLMIGDDEREVSGVLVSLDFDSEVLEQAIYENVNLIITHHPAIFSPMRAITDKLFLKAIENGISVFAMHTNLDWCKDGVCDCLAEKLGLVDVRPLSGEWIGRVGELAGEMELGEFVRMLGERLGGKAKFVGDMGKKVRRVGLVGGGGAEWFGAAVAAGCDVYVTADVRYHEAKAAWESGVALVDAGHFETENVVISRLAEMVRMWYNGKVVVGERESSYWNYNI